MTGLMEGKVALVTGAAQGMGRAIARRFAEEGADVIAFDILPTDEVEADVKATGREVMSFNIDVTDLAQVESAVADGLARSGHIDAAAINHGTTVGGSLWDTTPEQWKRVIDVNLTGAWNVARTLAPTLIKQGAGSSIVITASTSSLDASMNLGVYTASKHGVLGLMRNLAVELGPHLVRANAVLPGATDTPLLQNARKARLEKAKAAGVEPAISDDKGPGVLPIGLIQPEDIAAGVVWLASDQARYVTGVALPVDAGVLVAPRTRT